MNGGPATQTRLVSARGHDAPTRARTIDCSIVIVNWNVRDHLRACLRSIERVRDGLEIEIIVVDNDSRDGSAAMLADDFPGVRVIANNENRGFAAANNQGLAIAGGRYVLLLNPDTELHDGCLRSVLEHAETHPRLGAVGCRAFRPDGGQQSTIFRGLGLCDVLANVFVPAGAMRRSTWLGGFRYAGIDLDRPHEVDTIAGCFMLVRRTALEDVGGLDERFFMYGEEAEWCHRLRRHGWRVGYFPGASIQHHGGVSTALCRDEMTLAMARSQILLLQCTRGPVVAWVANLLMLLRDLPRAVCWCIVRPFVMHWGATRWTALRRSAARFRLHAAGLFRTDWTA